MLFIIEQFYCLFMKVRAYNMTLFILKKNVFDSNLLLFLQIEFIEFFFISKLVFNIALEVALTFCL
jgi:hypothetical protein